MGRRKRKPQNSNRNHPKKMQKFQQDQDHSNIVQYQEDGMRKIKPYIFDFETHAKGRWIGKKVMDVFLKEFRFETPLYYKAAIGGGLIRINGKPVKPDRIFHSQDFLQSRVHRHEPPVSGAPLEILVQNEDFIVINKPPSIPIHPAGKYRHNSIVYLMAKEHGLKGLHTFYRLDRLTSGLFIFAKSLDMVKKIDSQMRGRELHKVYLCKVKGEFPSEPMECSEPIFAVSHKIGVCRVSPDGKPAKTEFHRVSFDGETSIIKCTPFTGRMHQIRVHLQYLGFPVLNDPLYTGPVWGADQGKAGKIPFATNEEFIAELTRIHNREQAEKLVQLDCNMLVSELDPGIQAREQEDSTESQIGNTMSGKTDDSEAKNEDKIEILSGDNCVEAAQCDSSLTIKTNHNVVLECVGDTTGSEAAEQVQSRTSQSTSVSPECIVGDSNVTSVLDRTKEKVGEDGMLVDSVESAGKSYEPGAKRTKLEEDSAGTLSSAIDSSKGENTAMTESAQGNDTVEGSKEPEVSSGQHSTNSCDDSERTGLDESVDIPTSSTDGSTSQNPETRDGSTCVDAEDEKRNRLAMELCRECRQPLPDPEPESMMLYLHALMYKGPDFEFSAPLPQWAKEHMERTGSQIP